MLTDLGLPDPPGLARRTGRRADSRGSPRPCPTGGLRVELERCGSCQARHAKHGDVVVRVELDRARRQARRDPADLHDGVALAGDHVGVGHHQVGRRRPSRSPRSPAAGRTEHAHDAAARGADAAARRGSRASAAARRRPARGPTAAGRTAPARCRIGPDGGSSWLSSRRIAERWMSRAQRLGAWSTASATAPTIHAIPSPTHAVKHAPSSPSTARSPGSRSADRARTPSPSKPLASTPPASSAPIRPNSGAYCECEPPGSSSGASARAEERADREPDQRQRADDEALQIAVDSASSAVKATITQSIAVIGVRLAVRPRSSRLRPVRTFYRSVLRWLRRRRSSRGGQSPRLLCDGEVAAPAASADPCHAAGGTRGRGVRGRRRSLRAGPAGPSVMLVTEYVQRRGRAATIARMYSLLDSGLAARHVADAVRRRLTATAAATATLTSSSDRQRRQPPRRRDPRADARPHAAVRHAARDAGGARWPAAAQSAQRPVLAARCCSRDCGPASGSPAGRCSRRARRCSPATARRWPRGPSRTSPIPDVAGQIVGTLGPIPADEAASYAAQGYPPDAKVGLDGLERIFQKQLAGTPGGTLLAGPPRSSRSRPPSPATTSTPRSTRRSSGRRSPRWPVATPGSRRWTRAPARLLALAGVAFSALQPPGSTMKIITATGALEAGIVKLGTVFPIARRGHRSTATRCTTRAARFAAGRSSTRSRSRATPCSLRWARSSARAAWSRSPSGSASTRPRRSRAPPRARSHPAATSAAPSRSAPRRSGRARCSRSALEMTDVAATIAMGGRRPLPTLQAHQRRSFRPRHVAAIARLVQRMMIAVVAVRDRHRPRRSRACRSRARPAPPSCATPTTPTTPTPTPRRTPTRGSWLRARGQAADRGRGAVPGAGRRRRRRPRPRCTTCSRRRCRRTTRGVAEACARGASSILQLRPAGTCPRFRRRPRSSGANVPRADFRAASGTKASPTGGNFVEHESARPARSTLFPLSGMNVESAQRRAPLSTKFPPLRGQREPAGVPAGRGCRSDDVPAGTRARRQGLKRAPITVSVNVP